MFQRVKSFIDCICAYALGVVDAYEQNGDLFCGRTWEGNPDCNEAYDAGANFGERLYARWNGSQQ